MILGAFPLVSPVGSSFLKRKKTFMCMYVHVSVGACGGESVTFPLMTQVGWSYKWLWASPYGYRDSKKSFTRAVHVLNCSFLLFWFVCFGVLKQGFSV